MSAGSILRFARRRARLSQAELAERAGTAQSAISRIERDQISPTVRTLENLIDATGSELVMRTRRKQAWDDD